MPDLESIIPIVFGHNYADRPIGVAKFEDGTIKFKLNDSANLTVEQVQGAQKVFAPAYVITKEENGIVKELSLIAVSVIDSVPVK